MREIKKLRQRSIDCDLKMELRARVLSSRDFQETGSRGVAATGALHSLVNFRNQLFFASVF